MNGATRFGLGVALALALGGCQDPDPSAAPSAAVAPSALPSASASAPVLAPLPFLPAMAVPKDNPLTPEKIARGRRLFGQELGEGRACASCHRPDHGYGGPAGEEGPRHTPTLLNVGYQLAFGWDGRDRSLEARIDRELSARHDAGGARVADQPRAQVVAALASYLRTLRSGDAPFDRYELGDRGAVSEAAIRGHAVFRKKASCSTCHVPPLYTDHRFHNIGLGYAPDAASADRGRAAITERPKDEGAFKTPSLRSVTTTAPYFHDGRAATLEAAVDYMLSGGHAGPHLDRGLTKVVLTDDQRSDLLAFLRSLEAGP